MNLIVESYQHAFRTVMGREEDPDVIRSWIGRPLISAFLDHAPDHADQLYSTYLSWNADTERLIRGYVGALEVVVALREAEVQVGVATSKRRESAQQAMDLSASSPCRRAGGLEDTELHKPARPPLLLALERMGRSSNGAVYVGDAVVDLAGKAPAPLAVTWARWSARGRPATRRESFTTHSSVTPWSTCSAGHHQTADGWQDWHRP